MSKSGLILRFRDLVTDPGGTIAEHRALIRSQGATWWGWMKRPSEGVPREFFCRINRLIDAEGCTEVFLFDSGNDTMYLSSLIGLAVAPDNTKLGSPEPERTPEYYNRGRYEAWFCFDSISDFAPNPEFAILFESFPTKPHVSSLLAEVGRPFVLRNLKGHDVTLWAISMRRQ